MVRQKQELAARIEQEEDIRDKRLKIQIAKVEQKINNLVDGLADASGVTMKYLNEKITALEKEKRGLLQERQENRTSNITERQICQFADILVLWDQMSIEQRREIGKLLIERIQVYNDKVEICWKYNFMEQKASA